MWAVYSLLALLALVLVVLFVPVLGRVSYDGELTVKLRVLGIPITLTPRSEKPPKKSKKKPKKAKHRPKKEDKPSKWQEIKSLLKEDGVGSTLGFLKDVASLAGRTANKALKAVTVKQLRLHLLIATEDAAITAQRYGQVCGVLYPTLALVEQKVRVRRRQVRVEPNFLLEKSAVRFDVRFRVSLWRLIGAGFTLLWGFMMLQDKPKKS